MSRRQDKVYRTWMGIKQRCHNPAHPSYRNYGGRGIVMCEAWRADFTAFSCHIGVPPTPEHSIERIDNDRGYEPGNVKWATRSEQARNRRNTLHWVALAIMRHLVRRGEQTKAVAESFGVWRTTVEKNCRDLPIRVVRWCKHGHDFTAENTSWWNGQRRCVQCHRRRELARYHANRTAQQAKEGSK
jgi:hypothetical protein